MIAWIAWNFELYFRVFLHPVIPVIYAIFSTENKLSRSKYLLQDSLFSVEKIPIFNELLLLYPGKSSLHASCAAMFVFIFVNLLSYAYAYLSHICLLSQQPRPQCFYSCFSATSRIHWDQKEPLESSFVVTESIKNASCKASIRIQNWPSKVNLSAFVLLIFILLLWVRNILKQIQFCYCF